MFKQLMRMFIRILAALFLNSWDFSVFLSVAPDPTKNFSLLIHWLFNVFVSDPPVSRLLALVSRLPYDFHISLTLTARLTL